ncbi:MAG: formyltransferase family protein, partial [Ilumatobacteraceae bacterium]
MTRPRLVVLASGNGSNLQALIDAVDKGHINGQIVAVVSDRPESRALTRATDAGLLAAPLPIAEGERRDDYDRRLADLLSDLAPHLVVLAGWMRILTDTVVESFRVI